MAKGKYHTWLEPHNLEKLTNWAANGCNDTEIAHNMGISRKTFYVWIAEHGDIGAAIKNGRSMAVQAIENAFFRRALGGIEVTETVEEFRGEFRDGKPWNGTGMKRTVKKRLPPDTTACIFYLKNKAGYQDRPAEQQDEIVESMGDVFVKIREAADAAGRADS